MITKKSAKFSTVLALLLAVVVLSSCRRQKERCAAYDRVEVHQQK